MCGCVRERERVCVCVRERAREKETLIMSQCHANCVLTYSEDAFVLCQRCRQRVTFVYVFERCAYSHLSKLHKLGILVYTNSAFISHQIYFNCTLLCYIIIVNNICILNYKINCYMITELVISSLVNCNLLSIRN